MHQWIFVYTLVPKIGMNGAAYACAIGWTVMIGYQIVVYRKYGGKKAII